MEISGGVLSASENFTKKVTQKDLDLFSYLKGLKVAVAIAVIRVKPEKVTGVEFAEALYSLIVSKKNKTNKKNKEIKQILNSISISNSMTPGKPTLYSLFDKSLTESSSKCFSSNTQINILLSVAFLNKFNKFLVDKLSNLSSNSSNNSSISFSIVTDKIEIIYLETQSYLVSNKCSDTVKLGLQLVTEIANKLEVLCYNEDSDPVYKALLSYILNKTIEITGIVQQCILEATSFQDYFCIKRHTEVIELLSLSASLFTIVVKTLANCLSTLLIKLASTIFTSTDNLNDSRLNVCLFTNSGHLMDLMSKLFTSMAALVLHHENEDKKQNEMEKKAEKSKRKRKKDKLINKIVITKPSSRLCVVLKGDGCNFDYVLDSLGCVDSWLSKDPLFIMFMVKIKENVENLIEIVDRILADE